MAVVISPGILAAICILSVELVVIIIVIAFLLWRGKQGNKTHGIPQINGDKFETKTSTKDYKADVSNNQLEVTQEDKYMGNSLQKSNSIKSLNVSETKEPISESSGISCEDHILANGVFYETNEEEDVAKEDDIAAAHPPSVTYMAKEEENSEVLITSNDNTQVNFTDGNMLMETAVSNTEECPGPCTPRNTTQLVSLLPPPNSSVAEHSTPEFSKLSLKPTKKNATPDTPIKADTESLPRHQSTESFGGVTLSLRINQENSHQTLPGHDEQPTTSKLDDQNQKNLNTDKIQLQKFEVIRRYDHQQSDDKEEDSIVYEPQSSKFLSVGDPMTLSQSSEEDHSLDISSVEETVAGIINVTSGEKLTICEAVKKGLIPKKTAIYLLDAQAATGCVVNPRSGAKLSVHDAVKLGIVNESYKASMLAAEGAFYGYLDPRTGESISLNTAMQREIFPRVQGLRLLEAQVATGGIIDPWTGKRYSIASALSKGLVDFETSKFLMCPDEKQDFFDPNTKTRLGYSDILNKCIRDLDTGLKFLFIEERPKINSYHYQPDLLSFRSAFRRKITLQELIDANLVEASVLEAFQNGKINKEQLRDIFQPILVGDDPIGGILNEATNKTITISQAVKDGLLQRESAIELLEAQAATGNIIDPLSGKKMSVSRAITVSLVDRTFSPRLKLAEQAILGYSEPGTSRCIPLVEAMRRGLIIESQGIRLLEAQIATGGLIDPIVGYRIPNHVALSRGIFDHRLAGIISNSTDNVKSYFDPYTGGNLMYRELMGRCIRKKRRYGEVLLLPLKAQIPIASALQRGPLRRRDVIIVDPASKIHMSVNQALTANLIDEQTAEKLNHQGGAWIE